MSDKELSGGKEAASGLTFNKETWNEETWARAKPVFIEAAKEFNLAAGDVNQLMRLLIKEMHQTYKMSEQASQTPLRNMPIALSASGA